MQRLLSALVTAATIVIGMALSVPPARAVEVPAAAPVMAQLLFVQNAQGVEVGAGGRTITLKGLSPTTLFFSDRPVRIAGHYVTAEYLQFWKAGPDSFLKDPPNATLSVFEKGKDELSDVVVTLRNPRLSGNDLTYDITLISGTMPKTSGPASLWPQDREDCIRSGVARKDVTSEHPGHAPDGPKARQARRPQEARRSHSRTTPTAGDLPRGVCGPRRHRP